MHYSVATIKDPEFLNLRPSEYSPLISKCQIKVLYLGENRNHSSISKDAAMQLAKSLRGSPIVGHFREDTGDFGDHGEKIVIENNEIYFSCTTQPYGFVDLNAQIWFQKFNEIDDNGQAVEREYLVTEGLLWTGQYPELECLFDQGRPHSMELDEKNLQGSWTKSKKSDLEIFIINDGIFSKLCILGEDVEPCFEGSSIKMIKSFEEEQVASYSYTKSFTKTLYSMLQDLQREGRKEVPEEKDTVNVQIEDNVVTNIEEPVEEKVEQAETVEELPQDTVEESAQGEEAAEVVNEATEDCGEDSSVDCAVESGQDENDSNSQFQKLKEQFNLLNENFQYLTQQYQHLKEELTFLQNFKKQIDDKAKITMINSFTTLSDEDKAEILQNKDNLSLEEIESKLSILYTRQQRKIEAQQENESNTKEFKVTYSITAVDDYSPSGWEQAVKQNRKNKGV